jgi:cobalt-precorrin 5A hydrolase
MDQAMIVAGVGCRKGVQAADIEAAIVAAFDRAGVATSALRLIATSAAKGGEPGIAAAASAIGVPLVLIELGDLAAAGMRATTRSERVMALAGVPSVAEAAALAAGGPDARLIVPRIAVGPATCALAETEAAL